MIADRLLSVEEGYSLWASCYDDDGNPLIALEGPALIARFGAITGRLVIDLGCGTGRQTAALVDAGASVIACDLTPAMLGLARTKIKSGVIGWLRIALPGALPFRENCFTLAVLALVIEHINDLEGTFREVERILESGGRCLVSTLHPDLTRQGQTARFIDPTSGVRQPIQTVHREVPEMVAIAERSGLRLVEETSLLVPPELAEKLPRAARYVGTKLGWIAEFGKP